MTPYYQDDHVQLYHGDCLELADLWTVADVLVTDPPYGRAWRQGDTGTARGWASDRHEGIYLVGPGWGSGLGGRSAILRTGASAGGNLARKTGHPHTKPQDVMQTLIYHAPPGVIADPFAGSGSTLVAAQALGRKAIGVELDERYCEIAANRLRQDALDFGEAS